MAIARDDFPWMADALAIASQTKPADREQAEKALHEVCMAADTPRPKRLVWAESPADVGEWLSFANQRNDRRSGLFGDALNERIMPVEVRNSWNLGVEDLKWEQWRSLPSFQLRDLQQRIFATYCEFGAEIGGQFDSGDVLRWLHLQPEYARTPVAHVRALLKLSESCAWCWAYSEITLLCERPCLVRLNKNGALHFAGGPAISYRDGLSLYAIGGIPVPARLALAWENVTAEEIRQTENLELQRVLVEEFGLARYIEQIGAILLCADEYGELFEIPGSERPERIIKVINSTREPDGSRKEYFLRTSRKCKTPRAGIAWSFGLNENQYAPLVET